MVLRILVVSTILTLGSGCTVQTPLAEHQVHFLGAQSDDGTASRDEAAGENRQLGNPSATPQ